jgi:hypothetical protein
MHTAAARAVGSDFPVTKLQARQTASPLHTCCLFALAKRSNPEPLTPALMCLGQHVSKFTQGGASKDTKASGWESPSCT